MVFKIDYLGEETFVWSKKPDESVKVQKTNFIPSFYLKTRKNNLKDLQDKAEETEHVIRTDIENWKTKLGQDQKEKVVRVDTDSVNVLKDSVYQLRRKLRLDQVKFFNVDIARQFRYCLEQKVEPVPRCSLDVLELVIPKEQVSEKDLSALKIEGETFNSERKVLEALKQALNYRDPDILLLNTIQILPLVREKKEKHGIDFQLGRSPGFQVLAGESQFSSYGEVGHSPPRYNVPGRIIINKSNSFFYQESGIKGMIDLVNRSWKPLQETAWGSIGNQLTSIEMRYALHKRDTLIPYRVYSSEDFRDLETHKKGDRGGFTFSPKVGVFQDVYECDFASLYPNIMIEKGLSPETVRCNCHPGRSDVPDTGFSVCPDKDPFLKQVLKPIVNDRAQIKEQIEQAETKEEKEKLEEKSSALKWILVSCFGYQGHAHAKFGANKVHQSINAFDREIMLEAKKMFEDRGFQVLHGIVDSLWVKGREDKRLGKEKALKVCERASEEIGIDLEFEHSFDWICFVPRKNSQAGALTRYFGKKKSGGFKLRGIEARQDSTCTWIKEKQEELLHVLDQKIEANNPVKPVKERLKTQIQELESRSVDPRKLLIEKQVRKELEDYKQYNMTAASIDRAENRLGISIKPGQKARYVVVNQDADDASRVNLEFEELDRYDTVFYRDKLVKAAASITSPFGVREQDLNRFLKEGKRTKHLNHDF